MSRSVYKKNLNKLEQFYNIKKISNINDIKKQEEIVKQVKGKLILV